MSYVLDDRVWWVGKRGPRRAGTLTFRAGTLTFQAGALTFRAGTLTFRAGTLTFPAGAVTFQGGQGSFRGGTEARNVPTWWTEEVEMLENAGDCAPAVSRAVEPLSGVGGGEHKVRFIRKRWLCNVYLCQSVR